MEIEPLNAMNEILSLSLKLVEVITAMTIVFAIVAAVIYLAGVVWLCYEEKRQSKTAPQLARRPALPSTRKSAPRPAGTYVCQPLTHEWRVPASWNPGMLEVREHRAPFQRRP